MVNPFATLFRLWNARAVRMLADVPGPEPVLFAGNGLALLGKDLHTLFSRWCDVEYREGKHAGLVRFFLFHQPSLVSARPDLVRAVMLENEADWYKNVPRAATKPVGGESVFREPRGDAQWKDKRARHPFEARWAEPFYDGIHPIIARLTRERFEAREGRAFDLYAEILRVSFSAFSHAVFGEELPDEAFTEHETLLAEVGARGALPVAFSWNPVFFWRRRKWFARIEERLARGSLGEGATDLVSLLARHGALDAKSRLTRDELGNIFAAGMKNAAVAAAATTFLLARHPAVLARVLGELDAAGPKCTRAELVALPYFDRAVKESLRLYPGVAGFVREAVPGRKVMLDGVELPPRTQIFLVSWVVHRSPHVWPDPERFDPDRFLEEPALGTYFPFGLGPRYCVGRDWTLLVAKTIVSTLLSRWTLDIDPTADFETKLVSVLTVPKRAITTTLRPRDVAAEHASP